MTDAVKLVNTIKYVHGEGSPQFAKDESPFTYLSFKDSHWTFKRLQLLPGNYWFNKILPIQLRRFMLQGVIHKHGASSGGLEDQFSTNNIFSSLLASTFVQLFFLVTWFVKKWALSAKRQSDPTSRVRFLGPEWLGKWWDCCSLFEGREIGSCQCEMGKQTKKKTKKKIHQDLWSSFLSLGLTWRLTSRKPVRLSSLSHVIQKPLHLPRNSTQVN